jgi:methionyl aminopeptidase
MVTIKKPEEIIVMREGGRHLAATLALLASAVRPGISIRQLDDMARKELMRRGGTPAFLGYGAGRKGQGFPSTLCVSLNNEVVHGIGTRDIILKEGDIVGLDIGVQYPAKNGLFTDMATTVPVGTVSADAERLIRTTREALTRAIEKVGPGVMTSELAKTVQQICEAQGYGVIRDLTGHGVGYAVHEDPPIFCYWDDRLPNVELREGMVICIEPMVVMGDWRVKVDKDQWTVRTADGSLAAHEEHTIAVTREGHEILTQLSNTDGVKGASL